MLQVDRMLSGKSFMNIKNISGPSANPWGTLDFKYYLKYFSKNRQ